MADGSGANQANDGEAAHRAPLRGPVDPSSSVGPSGGLPFLGSVPGGQLSAAGQLLPVHGALAGAGVLTGSPLRDAPIVDALGHAIPHGGSLVHVEGGPSDSALPPPPIGVGVSPAAGLVGGSLPAAARNGAVPSFASAPFPSQAVISGVGSGALASSTMAGLHGFAPDASTATNRWIVAGGEAITPGGTLEHDVSERRRLVTLWKTLQDKAKRTIDRYTGRRQYVGVSRRGEGAYRAYIRQMGRQVSLGCFDSDIEAARAVDLKFAQLGRPREVFNFPDDFDEDGTRKAGPPSRLAPLPEKAPPCVALVQPANPSAESASENNGSQSHGEQYATRNHAMHSGDHSSGRGNAAAATEASGHAGSSPHTPAGGNGSRRSSGLAAGRKRRRRQSSSDVAVRAGQSTSRRARREPAPSEPDGVGEGGADAPGQAMVFMSLAPNTLHPAMWNPGSLQFGIVADGGTGLLQVGLPGAASAGYVVDGSSAPVMSSPMSGGGASGFPHGAAHLGAVIGPPPLVYHQAHAAGSFLHPHGPGIYALSAPPQASLAKPDEVVLGDHAQVLNMVPPGVPYSPVAYSGIALGPPMNAAMTPQLIAGMAANPTAGAAAGLAGGAGEPQPATASAIGPAGQMVPHAAIGSVVSADGAETGGRAPPGGVAAAGATLSAQMMGLPPQLPSSGLLTHQGAARAMPASDSETRYNISTGGAAARPAGRSIE